MKDAIQIPGSSGRWSSLWEIQSESRVNVSYIIGVDRLGHWGCSCPQWIYHTPRRDCKHIQHVQNQLARKVETRVYTPAEVEAKPAIQKAISRFSLIEID